MLRAARLAPMLAAALLAALLAAPGAGAGAPPARVVLAPAIGPAGSAVALRGGGFAPGATVTVRLGEALVATRRADARGRFAAALAVPGDAAPGRLAIAVRARGQAVDAGFAVTAAPGARASSAAASASGAHAVLTPAVVAPGATYRLAAAGLPRRARVAIALAGARAWTGRAGPDGRLARALRAPAGRPGPRALVLRAGRTTLRLALRLTASLPASSLLVAAGDIACPPEDPVTAVTCHQEATAKLVEGLAPDVVAPLGDLQYLVGAPAAFRGSFAPTWGRLEARMRPVPGNHEYYTPGAAGYYAYFGARAGAPGRGYYAYDLGHWRIYALNSNCTIVGCAPGSEQERWLRDDLAANPSRCVLATWHHPRFSSGLHGDDPAVDGLWRALARAGADVVLSGHDHQYERFVPLDAEGRAAAGGVREFVVGTGGVGHYAFMRARAGSALRHSGTFGVLALRLSADGYAWRFVPEAGARFADAGTGRCGPAAGLSARRAASLSP